MIYFFIDEFYSALLSKKRHDDRKEDRNQQEDKEIRRYQWILDFATEAA
jgi:hypothetical protein